MTPSPSYTVAMPSVDEPGGGIDPRGTRVMPSGHPAGALPSPDDYHDRTERSARRHRDEDDEDDDDDGHRRSSRSARGDRGQRGARGRDRDRDQVEAKGGRRARGRRRRLPIKTIGIIAGSVVAAAVVVVLIVGVMSGSQAPKRKKTRVVSSALEARPSLVTAPSETGGDEGEEPVPEAPRPPPRRLERQTAPRATARRAAASAAERLLVETLPPGARVCRKKDKKFLGKAPLEVTIGGQTLPTEVLILELDGYARATAQLPLRGPIALKKQGPNEAIRLPECEDPKR